MDRCSEDGRPRLSKTELQPSRESFSRGLQHGGRVLIIPGTPLLHLRRTRPPPYAEAGERPPQPRTPEEPPRRMCKASGLPPTLGGGAGRRCCFLDRTRRLVRLRRERGESTETETHSLAPRDPVTGPRRQPLQSIQGHRECPVFLFSSPLWLVCSEPTRRKDVSLAQARNTELERLSNC